MVFCIDQTAIGPRDTVSFFGNNYKTLNGTGVQGYIHITDLAQWYAAAVDYVTHHSGSETINLGTGHSHSVLEIIAAFETASGQ
ncbi:hypothetical protein OAP51_07330 [Alphaproteobacteria bacterium]|nr:hypothetical protein [Alphaproteobacteria bacterium]